MNLQRLLGVSEGLALALLALIHLVVRLDLVGAAVSDSETFAVLRDATDFSQLALILIWALLGPGAGRWRLPASGALLLAWCYAPATWAARGSWRLAPRVWVAYGTDFLIAYVAVLAVLLFALRLARVGVVRDNEGAMSGLRFQFSLRMLFALVIASAIAVRGAQWLYGAAVENSDLGWRFAFAGLGATLAIVAGFALWAAMSPGNPWGRILALCIVAPLLAFFPPYMGGKVAAFVPLVYLHAALAAVMAGSLLVVNSCGYALLVMPRRENSPATPHAWLGEKGHFSGGDGA